MYIYGALVSAISSPAYRMPSALNPRLSSTYFGAGRYIDGRAFARLTMLRSVVTTRDDRACSTNAHHFRNETMERCVCNFAHTTGAVHVNIHDSMSPDYIIGTYLHAWLPCSCLARGVRGTSFFSHHSGSTCEVP